MHFEPQTNYQLAFEQGLDQVRRQESATLDMLGAKPVAAARYDLAVLETGLSIDLDQGSVRLRGGGEVRIAWQILALHYLGASPPWPEATRWFSFADFAEARGYNAVHRGRVLERLCATVGRDRETFCDAAQRLGAERVGWGDAGFRFQVFPRLAVAIAWYCGDGELPPSASFLYPDNVLSFFPVEDMVVLSERVIGRLQGKGW